MCALIIMIPLQFSQLLTCGLMYVAIDMNIYCNNVRKGMKQTKKKESSYTVYRTADTQVSLTTCTNYSVHSHSLAQCSNKKLLYIKMLFQLLITPITCTHTRSTETNPWACFHKPKCALKLCKVNMRQLPINTRHNSRYLSNIPSQALQYTLLHHWGKTKKADKTASQRECDVHDVHDEHSFQNFLSCFTVYVRKTAFS